MTFTHPIQNIRPALCGDTLIHSEHRETQIIKVSYAVIGPGPSPMTLGSVQSTAPPVTGLSAWRRLLVLYRRDDVCDKTKQRQFNLFCLNYKSTLDTR